jgi:hypothetical protein
MASELSRPAKPRPQASFPRLRADTGFGRLLDRSAPCVPHFIQFETTDALNTVRSR